LVSPIQREFWDITIKEIFISFFLYQNLEKTPLKSLYEKVKGLRKQILGLLIKDSQPGRLLGREL